MCDVTEVHARREQGACLFLNRTPIQMIPIRSTTAAALLLFATACGGGDAERSAAPDSAAAPAQADSQAAMVHQHGEQEGDTTLTLRAGGLGPLRVGMTAAQAKASLGHFKLTPFDPSAPVDSMACGYARSMRFPAGVKVMMDSARVARVEVDSGTVATAEGARIGDTEARIQQLYAGRVEVQPHKYTDGHYLVVRPAEASDTTHLLVFETDGRAVLRYRGGRRPHVEYVEGCS
jgi:hypothetical protein